MTFQGNYNASATVSYDGKKIAVAQGSGNIYRIALMDSSLGSPRWSTLSPGSLDESPSFAPNASMVLYAAREGRRGVLYAVSADARVRQRLVLADGESGSRPGRRTGAALMPRGAGKRPSFARRSTIRFQLFQAPRRGTTMNKTTRILLTPLLCTAGRRLLQEGQGSAAARRYRQHRAHHRHRPTTPGLYGPNDLDSDACLRQRVVYFDLDQDALKPEFQATMACHAKYLRDRPSSRMTLEGNADERGSREYNQGLGERRGNAVSSALQANGGSGTQVTSPPTAKSVRPAPTRAQGRRFGQWVVGVGDEPVLLGAADHDDTRALRGLVRASSTLSGAFDVDREDVRRLRSTIRRRA